MFLINFIRNNSNWEELLTNSPYNLKISRDGDYIMFKYNQIESDFSLPEVCEARGIIFRESNWDCVCRPFIKFFNYGEPNAAKINWDNITITEKIDGSLMKLWYDNGKWHLSTNGTIDASKAVVNDIKHLTFADLFYEVFNIEIIDELDKNSTHMFELVSPENRVVIPYDKTELYYLASHNNKTGQEWYNNILINNFKNPRRVHFNTLRELVEYCNKLEWTSEGFVVYDGFNRIKVKSPAYVKAHYARNNGNLSWNRLVEIVMQNEQDEFLVYASDYLNIINQIEQRIYTLTGIAEAHKSHFIKICELSRKEYAKAVSNVEPIYRPFLFKIYDNHELTFRSYLMQMPISRLVKILNFKV